MKVTNVVLREAMIVGDRPMIGLLLEGEEGEIKDGMLIAEVNGVMAGLPVSQIRSCVVTEFEDGKRPIGRPRKS